MAVLQAQPYYPKVSWVNQPQNTQQVHNTIRHHPASDTTWCQKRDWKRKDSHRTCGQQFNSKDWCKSDKLKPVSETNMASASLIDKGPSIDWMMHENLYSRFKMWKRRCELLFPGPWQKLTRKSSVNIY